ncbi:MAG: flavin reductase family protein [Clostridiales bacterium]|nr:flavin reductase family protein [Clostridiales bacterium]
MKQISYLEGIAQATEKMSRNGVFLSVAGSPANVMTIGWGSVGFFWTKPVFLAVVRPQRHTHALLQAAREFTVSVPTALPLTSELAFAGRASGATVDKFVGHGLTAAPAQVVGAPIVAECGLHFECRVALEQPMSKERMADWVAARAYPGGDLHTMFFGEIVACYRTDEA